MPRRRTTDEGLLVYGVNAVLGALRSTHSTVCVYVGPKRAPDDVTVEVARSGVRLEEVSTVELDRLSGGARHQGVAIRVRSFRYAPLEDVIATSGRGVVMLDGIMDPRNLGAIVRSARAAGVRGVVLPSDRSVAVTAVAAVASAGTVFGMAVARVPNLTRAMREVKDAGMWTVGLAADADRTLAQVPQLDEPALVIGAEGEGLRRLVRERCDFVARVPMSGPVESLNASVAAGVALYELVLRDRDGV